MSDGRLTVTTLEKELSYAAIADELDRSARRAGGTDYAFGGVGYVLDGIDWGEFDERSRMTREFGWRHRVNRRYAGRPA